MQINHDLNDAVLPLLGLGKPKWQTFRNAYLNKELTRVYIETKNDNEPIALKNPLITQIFPEKDSFYYVVEIPDNICQPLNLMYE